MKSKALVVILIIVGLLAGGGGVAYSAMQAKASARTFSDGGYILTADADSPDKQLLFAGGTQWKNMPDERILFKDVQGERKEITNQSFVHYASSNLSALSDGVVVDLNDVSNARMTNHYAVSSRILFEGNGGSYVLSNTAAEYQFRDFMWKLSESKYMIVSDKIELELGDGETRVVNNFVEVSYIDNGIIQFQTEENLWQTVAPECMGELGNGELVDFAMRNVQDPEGEVLLDFGKVVLDSEDNIEVIPMDDRLENVFESIIPHFNIKAEPGEDGEDGLEGDSGEEGLPGGNGIAGEDGLIGEDGYFGEPGDPGDAGLPGDPGANGGAGAPGSGGSAGATGDAGANGAPGASGVNGGAGAPGAPGNPGNDGKATEIEGKVLKFPVFNLEVPENPGDTVAWTVSANGCRGNIMVEDDGLMLISNSSALHAEVYLTDLSTSEIIYPEGYDPADPFSYFDFSTLRSEGYPFEFKGLQPDHAYMLQVTAPIQTDTDSEPYSRAFITKTFWTDSTGIYMEPAESTLTSVSANIVRSYKVDGIKTGVLLFKTPEEAAAAPLTGWEEVTNFDDPKQWTGLDPNASYYARLAYDLDGDGNYEKPGDQILELKTLKRTASVGAPTLTANRGNWGFDLTPGKVTDIDKGITGYTYEFYNEGFVITDAQGKTSLRSGATPVTTLHSQDTAAFVVPMDGTMLVAGRTYYVRTIAEFDDNEKTYTVTSELSNPCSVQGSQLPSVYYTPLGNTGTGHGTATTTSPKYDEIVGSLHVDPSSTGAKLLIDKDHIPTVTIRANGYYYVQYPVYTQKLADTLSITGKDYLIATIGADGNVTIQLPEGAVDPASVNVQGFVNGLTDDMAYEIIVNGSLTQDQSTALEEKIEVGRCVVETPKVTPIQVSWPSVTTEPKKTASFAFTPYDRTSDQFNRQMDMLSSLTVTLYSGKKPEPGEEEAGVMLAQTTLQLDNEHGEDGKVKKLLDTTNGLKFSLDDEFMGVLDNSPYSSVHLTLSSALDYTMYEANRVNQNAYVKDVPGKSPYINEFELINASCDIAIGNQPDPIPDKGKGFDILEPQDTDNDRDYNDSFILHPNYANTAKLATAVTYYVFDAVDFYKDYRNDNKWAIGFTPYENDTSYTLTTPVSVIGTSQNPGGEGTLPWLGSVTVPVDSSTGVIPKVNFIPMTKSNYAASKSLTPAELGNIDNNGNYYMFFKDGSTEPETGHQFVFAWTLCYTKTDESSVTTYNVYPFAREEYRMNIEDEPANATPNGGIQGYLNIPHSEVVDVPRALPTIYAIPWTADWTSASSHDVIWKVHVSDPDGAIVKSSANGATLYERTSATSGIKLHNSSDTIELPVSSTLLANTSDASVLQQIMSSPDSWNVIITDDRIGSHTAALRVQRYTDKYTPDNSGLFVAGNYIEESFDGEWNIYDGSTAKQSSSEGFVIPWYTNAFTYYVETEDIIEPGELYDDTANKSLVTVDIREASVSNAVNDYRVTITGPKATLEKANSVRLIISSGTTSISLDKVLFGKDYALGDNNKPATGVDIVTTYTENSTEMMKISTRMSIKDEVSSLAGSSAEIRALLLYETDDIGYKSVYGLASASPAQRAAKDFSLVAYNRKADMNDTGKPVLDFSERLYFSDSKTVRYRGDYKLGSVFNNLTLTDTGLDYASTRAHLYGTGYTSTYNINPATDWSKAASGHVMVPCVLDYVHNPLSDQPVYTSITFGGHAGEHRDVISMSVRNLAPQIEYKSTETGVSHADVNYRVVGLPAGAKVFFTLEKMVDGEMYMYQYLQYFDGVSQPKVGNVSATIFLTGDFDEFGNKKPEYPPAYGAPTGDDGITFKLDDVLNHINRVDTEAYNHGGRILTEKPVADTQISYEYLSANVSYYSRCWYWDENVEWRNPAGVLVGKGGFVALNMPGESGDLIPNYHNFLTARIPELELVPAEKRRSFFFASNYGAKWLAAELKVANATNYYWTLELQQKDESGDWQFATWLGVGNGNGIDLKSSYAQYYDIDGLSSTLSTAASTPRHAYGTVNGSGEIETIPQYRIGLDELTNSSQIINGRTVLSADIPAKTDSSEDLYLEYGRTYRVRARLYDLGTGPAFATAGNPYDMATDAANLMTYPEVSGEDRAAKQAEIDAKIIKEFTVPSSTDYISITGTESSSPTGGSVITFTPNYTANGMYTVRDKRFAAVVIRSHTDENATTSYYDVSHLLRYGERGNWFDYIEGYGSVGYRTPLYLDIPAEYVNPNNPENWIGDSFTCYIYAIQDHVTEEILLEGVTAPKRGDTSCKDFPSELTDDARFRAAIMQDRPDVAYSKYREAKLNGTTFDPPEGGYPITIAERAALMEDRDITVFTGSTPDGFSRLMAQDTKEFRSDAISAGNIFAVWDSSEKKIIIQLVNMVNPDKINRMRVDVMAEYDAGDSSIGSETWGDYITTSLSGNSGTINITPSFANIPSGAKISSYLITACFQTQEEGGDYVNVPIYSTGELGGTVSSDYHYTQPVDPNANVGPAASGGPALMSAPLRMSVWMAPAGSNAAPAEQSGFLQSGNEITPLGTSAEPAAEPVTEKAAEVPVEGAETPPEVPAEIPAETPAETPTEVPAEPAAEPPTEALTVVPIQPAAETPAETSAESAVETPVETPTETPAETPAEPAVEEVPQTASDL